MPRINKHSVKYLKMKYTTFKRETKKQKEIINACRLNNGIDVVTVATGRQVGNSTVALEIGAKMLLHNRDLSIAMFFPCGKKRDDAFNRMIKGFCNPKDELDCVYNKYESRIYSEKTGSSIQFFDCTKTDWFRGLTFDCAIVDDPSYISEEAWLKSIQPSVSISLSSGEGCKLLLIGCSYYKNWFYRVCTNGIGRTTHKHIKFSTLEGGLVAAHTLDIFEKDFGKDYFEMEYLCEFPDKPNVTDEMIKISKYIYRTK